MKKLITLITALTSVVASFTLVSAKDVLMKNKEVKSVTVAFTKGANNEYCRINIKEPRELNGIKYTTSVAVMVFDKSLLNEAKGLTPGTKFSFIADQGTYKGRNSYTVLAFVDVE